MGGIDIVLEVALLGLLSMTLLHAIRLQRTLSALRQDRVAFDAAVQGFDTGTRQVGADLSVLREAADRLEAQLHRSGVLKDDLAYLSERGEKLADQLELLVRTGRSVNVTAGASAEPAAPVRSQAERSLLLALQARR
ncbi:MAG: DUF6468 domain-containing protein [Janthinobacterium lividum]